MTESLGTASEQYDLHSLRGFKQNVGHELQTFIV